MTGRSRKEDDPSYARWSVAIWREMAKLREGAVVAGHSVGGTILISALTDRPPARRLGAIALIAAPFVGEGGWPTDDVDFSGNLGNRLPPQVPVHVFHGLQDEIAPPGHADPYACLIPWAQVHRLSGRDHQLNNGLSEVADVVLGHLDQDRTRA